MRREIIDHKFYKIYGLKLRRKKKSRKHVHLKFQLASITLNLPPWWNLFWRWLASFRCYVTLFSLIQIYVKGKFLFNLRNNALTVSQKRTKMIIQCIWICMNTPCIVFYLYLCHMLHCTCNINWKMLAECESFCYYILYYINTNFIRSINILHFLILVFLSWSCF